MHTPIKGQERVRGVVLVGSDVVLIHRRKNDEEYWVFPGGGVEEGESRLGALRRELLEELGIDAEVEKELISRKLEDSSGLVVTESFYYCSIRSGKLGTGQGEEFTGNLVEKGNYLVETVPLCQLENLRVLPEEVKMKLISEVKK